MPGRVIRRSGASSSAGPSKKVNQRRATSKTDDDDEMTIHGGWTDAQKQMDAASSYAQSFLPGDEGQIIKFLEDVPYANYRRHWVERASAQGGTVRRPYLCLGTFNKECPLCDIGDRAQAVSSFNVVVLGDDGQTLLKSWDLGVRLLKVVKAYNSDKRVGPLTKGYFHVTKTGKGNNSQTNITPIKASALYEDWDTEPVDEDELDKIKAYTPDILEKPRFKELKDIAAELSDEYE